MRWEQRLRDMILAGGALVAGACVDHGTDVVANVQPSPSYACCNANYDPCCTCDGLDAAIDPVACSQQTACEADGGAVVFDVLGGSSRCELPQDAAPADDASTVGPSDGADDVVPMSCCNANYDPCCACDGPDAALETTAYPPECAVERACVADGGTYDALNTPQPDGSYLGPHCAPGPRPGDGGADGDGHD